MFCSFFEKFWITVGMPARHYTHTSALVENLELMLHKLGWKCCSNIHHPDKNTLHYYYHHYMFLKWGTESSLLFLGLIFKFSGVWIGHCFVFLSHWDDIGTTECRCYDLQSPYTVSPYKIKCLDPLPRWKPHWSGLFDCWKQINRVVMTTRII